MERMKFFSIVMTPTHPMFAKFIAPKTLTAQVSTRKAFLKGGISLWLTTSPILATSSALSCPAIHGSSKSELSAHDPAATKTSLSDCIKLFFST
jgi:hypothetical protein